MMTTTYTYVVFIRRLYVHCIAYTSSLRRFVLAAGPSKRIAAESEAEAQPTSAMSFTP